MASTTLPWERLWQAMWGMIPSPATEERIIVALDDSINPKSGRKIFGCAHFHDHAGKEKPEFVSLVPMYTGNRVAEESKITMGLSAT